MTAMVIMIVVWFLYEDDLWDILMVTTIMVILTIMVFIVMVIIVRGMVIE